MADETEIESKAMAWLRAEGFVDGPYCVAGRCGMCGRKISGKLARSRQVGPECWKLACEAVMENT